MVQRHEPHPQPLPLEGDFRNTSIMAHLKDSLLSQLNSSLSSSPSVHNHHSPHIESRLQQLFPSFHTPTHPPYALMIRRAITELNNGNGSTEEEISEFVRMEYQDLPWAHVKILAFHLKKLCQVGEFAFTEGGRYMLGVDGGEETQQQCEDSRRRKRSKSRRNHIDGEREKSVKIIEIEEGNGFQECHQLDSAGTGEPNRVVESTQEKGEQEQEQAPECDHSLASVEEQTQSEEGWLEVVGKPSQHTEAEAPGPNELQESEIQKAGSIYCAEGSPECIISTTGPGIELSSPTQLQPQISSEINLDAVSEKTAPLTCVNVHDHKLPQHYNQGNPNGNLDENPMHGCLEDKLHDNELPQHYNQGNPNGNLDENPMLGCLEEKLHDNELPRHYNQGTPNGNLDENPMPGCLEEKLHDDELPQHDNQGNLNGNLDENPMLGCLEERSPKRPRGRPRKSVANCEEESLLHIIHKKQALMMNKSKKYHGPVRPRGRPRKVNQDTEQCGEQLWQEDQAKQSGRGRGRGPRGRPRKVNQDTEQCGEQLQQEDHAERSGRGRGLRGRPRKVNQDTEQCGEQLRQENQAEQSGRGRGRGRGRPPKLNLDTNQ